MEAKTAGQQKSDRTEPELGPGAPGGLEKAAGDEDQQKSVTPREEREALAYLLGSGGKAFAHTVPIEWDTDDGRKTIKWKIRSMAGTRIDEIEREARKDENDPFAGINQYQAAAGIVAEATVFPDVKSEEFRTPPEGGRPDADPADALQRIFRYQSGVLVGLAERVREISGWGEDRVGQAKRDLVRAAGNSSS